MKLQYRAIEGTNTQTRRLAYLTAIVSALRHESFSRQFLLTKLVQWNEEHKGDLEKYLVKTGEVRRNSAGAHYLELTTKLGIITPIAGAYRVTRIGLVLYELIQRYKRNDNPFVLNDVEKIFYTYQLLGRDADMLLTIMDHIAQAEESSLSQLQKSFQKDFLRRLEQKSPVCQDESVRQRLLERRIEVSDKWMKPELYAEHLVPPRLNWLLDLGFLKQNEFRRHHYVFGAKGTDLLSAIPTLECGSFHHDITERWLASEYWEIAARTLAHIESQVYWERIDEEQKCNLAKPLLLEIFEVFRYSSVPKVSLTQALLYLGIRILLDHKIIVCPATLGDWLSLPRMIDRRRYAVRFSPRENESYITVTAI